MLGQTFSEHVNWTWIRCTNEICAWTPNNAFWQSRNPDIQGYWQRGLAIWVLGSGAGQSGHVGLGTEADDDEKSFHTGYWQLIGLGNLGAHPEVPRLKYTGRRRREILAYRLLAAGLGNLGTWA